MAAFEPVLFPGKKESTSRKTGDPAPFRTGQTSTTSTQTSVTTLFSTLSQNLSKSDVRGIVSQQMPATGRIAPLVSRNGMVAGIRLARGG
jgi:hypothetical protein